MLVGLYIVIDDDFQDPVYAEPPAEDLDEELWSALCEQIQEALEGEGPARGHVDFGEARLVWRSLLRFGISLVAITRGVQAAEVQTYLKQLAERYFDEVDDVRQPDRPGVSDVVVDVIPPWDDEI